MSFEITLNTRISCLIEYCDYDNPCMYRGYNAFYAFSVVQVESRITV